MFSSVKLQQGDNKWVKVIIFGCLQHKAITEDYYNHDIASHSIIVIDRLSILVPTVIVGAKLKTIKLTSVNLRTVISYSASHSIVAIDRLSILVPIVIAGAKLKNHQAYLSKFKNCHPTLYTLFYLDYEMLF